MFRKALHAIWIAFILSLALTLLASAQGKQPGSGPRQIGEAPFLTLDNDYIRVSVDNDGQFVIGTTGGDPALPTDDNKRLLYGYPNEIWSSFPSLRVLVGDQRFDTRISNLPPVEGPVLRDNAIVTTWEINGIRVTQILSLAFNIYTGREDTVRIRYHLQNVSDTPRSAGLRSMLDIAIGGTGGADQGDGAPYFVPGAGNLLHEAEFRGEIPAIWKAFESPSFDPASTKGQGILVGPGATPPDRFVIARWGRADQGDGLVQHTWDYTVDPNASITVDSAVALYWNPVELAPGEGVTYTTFYGLAGPGGGQNWIDAPVALTCPDLVFPVTYWVVNTGDEPFTGGSATITLPEALQLIDTPATQPLGDIQPGQARSATWRVMPRAGAVGTFDYSVTSQFATGTTPLTASAGVNVPTCPTPTPGATPSPTPTVMPQVTPAGPTPTPPPEVPEASTSILLGSGLSALAGYVGLRRRRRRS